MSSDVATGTGRDDARPGSERRWQSLAIRVLGPLTVVGGFVWAVAQPYRIVFFDHDGRNLYDYLFEGPLLVVFVGLLFTFGVAPGLVEDLDVGEQRDT